MPHCRTPGCTGDPIDQSIVDVLGAHTRGLCEKCTVGQAKDRDQDQDFVLGPAVGHNVEETLEVPAESKAVDEGLKALRELLDQHERGSGTLLEDIEQQIIQLALEHHRIRPSLIARKLDVHRSTVYRRVRKLRGIAAARTPMTSQHLDRLRAMLLTLAGAPGGTSPEGYEKAAKIARKHRRHPIDGWGIGLEGDRLIVTGPGPIPEEVQELIRTGQAERRHPAGIRQCLFCEKLLPHNSNGRPRKYCDERCRSRHRRRTA